MKRIFSFVFVFAVFFSVDVAAQSARHKIAVFTPLYLDSVFTGSSYRYGSTFPKFINPGLEFYQGAQMAFDSLQKAGAPLEVFIYDSKSKKTSISQQLNSPELNNVEMIIGHANSAEVKILADAALKRKIPFISATLPNDAGVTDNPYMVVLNSTLRAHAEGIYRFLQKYHSLDRIIMFRKNGVQENLIRDYFNDITQITNSTPLKIDYVDLGSSFGAGNIIPRLDSTKNNIIIAGSLDENFGINLSRSLAAVKETYPIEIIGMPTWDNMTEFSKKDYEGMNITYSSPFYYTRYNSLGAKITNAFEANINARPTDMFYRGYEVALRFALLLLDTKKDVSSNLTRKGNYIFTPFDIQPVFLNNRNMSLDYFENKYLHFIRIQNGVKTTVN